MADLSDAQRKRAEGRQRRRSRDDSQPDEPQAAENGGGDESHHPVKQAAKVAAAVGAAGAAAAAAKALTSHHDGGDDNDEQEAADDRTPAEPQAEEAEAPQPEPEEPEQEDDPAPEEPVAGTPASDARKVIDQAREQLADLLERPVETVSSLERTHDGWVAQLEVVELTRIPESTDVLATYELELDGDLNLRRYQQVRRYTRSQASRSERE